MNRPSPADVDQADDALATVIAHEPPDCTHRPVVRVSSHRDLVAAARSRVAMFSMACCRGKCRDRARAYIRSLGYEPVEVDW